MAMQPFCLTPVLTSPGSLVNQSHTGKPGAAAGCGAGVAAKIPVVALLTSQTQKRMEEAGASWCVKDYNVVMQRVKEDGAA